MHVYSSLIIWDRVLEVELLGQRLIEIELSFLISKNDVTPWFEFDSWFTYFSSSFISFVNYFSISFTNFLKLFSSFLLLIYKK